MGHNKSSCKESKKIVIRLTPFNWSHLQIPQSEPIISDELNDELIDPIVPKSAMGLQILGKSQAGNLVFYKALVVLPGLQVVHDCILWLQEDVITVWATSGKSSSHLVFVRNHCG